MTDSPPARARPPMQLPENEDDLTEEEVEALEEDMHGDYALAQVIK